MPSYYQGTHTGQEVDAGLDIILAADRGIDALPEATDADHLLGVENGAAKKVAVSALQRDALEAFVKEKKNGDYYERPTLSGKETGNEVKFSMGADRIPMNELTVTVLRGQVPTLSVTVEPETVMANQLVRFGTPYWTNVSGQATISVSGTDTMVMTKTANTAQTSDYSFRMGQTAPWRLGHKYFVSATITPDKLTTMFFGNHDHKRATFSALPAGVATPVSEVFTLPATETDVTYMVWMANQSAGYTQGEKILLKDIMLIDLTVMFGVDNEPGTVADFLNAFPNASSFMSADRTGTKMSRLNGQTLFSDYLGETYTIDLPDIPELGADLTWYVTDGKLYDNESSDVYDVPKKTVPTFLGYNRIFCSDVPTDDPSTFDPDYGSVAAAVRLDPTMVYESITNTISGSRSVTRLAKAEVEEKTEEPEEAPEEEPEEPEVER